RRCGLDVWPGSPSASPLGGSQGASKRVGRRTEQISRVHAGRSDVETRQLALKADRHVVRGAEADERQKGHRTVGPGHDGVETAQSRAKDVDDLVRVLTAGRV